MAGLRSDIDPDGLLEYSVVFTDRSLNHMSRRFQGVVNDILGILKQAYRAPVAVLVPGGGSYGMEAVARQFATDQRVLVIRNGWFSFRWSQIFEAGRIPAEEIVLKARAVHADRQAPFAPVPVEEVVDTIRARKPQLVFAPHVETAAGILLPDAYLKAVADAVHEVGGLFVLDCVASGAVWVDMEATGVDVLISAPQKGWSGSPCAAFVMLSALARARIDQTSSTSFAADLKKWMQIGEAYEKGGHAYHATMPTDALLITRNAMIETRDLGFDKACSAQWELGQRVRQLLASYGFKSVAAPGFEAPGVVVSHTDDDLIHTGKAFLQLGLQTASGVPLRCDEPADFKTFRIGLFGLDKLTQVDRTVASLAAALDQMGLKKTA